MPDRNEKYETNVLISESVSGGSHPGLMNRAGMWGKMASNGLFSEGWPNRLRELRLRGNAEIHVRRFGRRSEFLKYGWQQTKKRMDRSVVGETSTGRSENET
ncbi:MAG: hypothetical protein LUG93_04770 [Lachnospiraceae bacterium]|nr:hypothetical protein [Lachnospiraceae bacterium]